MIALAIRFRYTNYVNRLRNSCLLKPIVSSKVFWNMCVCSCLFQKHRKMEVITEFRKQNCNKIPIAIYCLFFYILSH